jgi:hypothetical protein
LSVNDLIRLVCPREEREARETFMKRCTSLSRGIRDAGISKSRKQYRIAGKVGHLWCAVDTRNMTYEQLRAAAMRANNDMETYGWDADKLLDYWESKSQPAGQKSAPGGRESSEGEGGSSQGTGLEPEGEEI